MTSTPSFTTPTEPSPAEIAAADENYVLNSENQAIPAPNFYPSDGPSYSDIVDAEIVEIDAPDEDDFNDDDGEYEDDDDFDEDDDEYEDGEDDGDEPLF